MCSFVPLANRWRWERPRGRRPCEESVTLTEASLCGQDWLVDSGPQRAVASAWRPPLPLPLFWKCVKRKGFKSFVLKVCETKGFAGAFLRKCVKRKSLGGIL